MDTKTSSLRSFFFEIDSGTFLLTCITVTIADNISPIKLICTHNEGADIPEIVVYNYFQHDFSPCLNEANLYPIKTIRNLSTYAIHFCIPTRNCKSATSLPVSIYELLVPGVFFRLSRLCRCHYIKLWSGTELWF